MNEYKIQQLKQGTRIKAYINGNKDTLTFRGIVKYYEYPFIKIQDLGSNQERLLNIYNITNIEIL